MIFNGIYFKGLPDELISNILVISETVCGKSNSLYSTTEELTGYLTNLQTVFHSKQEGILNANYSTKDDVLRIVKVMNDAVKYINGYVKRIITSCKQILEKYLEIDSSFKEDYEKFTARFGQEISPSNSTLNYTYSNTSKKDNLYYLFLLW